MWQLVKVLSVAAFLVSGVFVLYGLVKVGRAEEASATKPALESGVPGVEISRVEPARAADTRSQGMAVLAGSGLALATSVVAFGYATLKGGRKPT